MAKQPRRTPEQIAYAERLQKIESKHGRVAVNCAAPFTTRQLDRIDKALVALACIEKVDQVVIDPDDAEDNEWLKGKIESALAYRKELEEK